MNDKWVGKQTMNERINKLTSTRNSKMLYNEILNTQ